jgi:hypothetical protein
MPKAKRAFSTSQFHSRSPSTSSSREKKWLPHELPFVRSVSDKKSPLYPCDFWAVRETGDYGFDYKLGDGLADAFVDFIGKRGPDRVMNDLTQVVNSMISKGPDFCSGVRIGFLNRLTYRLIVITRHH